MPNRIIREALLTSPKVAKLKFDNRWLYVGLLLCADDYGRIEYTSDKMHVRINELERENKTLARTCKRLRATIEKLRERGPGFVFGQSGKVLEQFRRAM